MTATFPFLRLRRLRHHPVLRELIKEIDISLDDLIFPLFIKGREGNAQPIASMPGIEQLPLSLLEKEVKELEALGISSVILFGIPSYKDEIGSASCLDTGIIQEAIREIHRVSPDMLVISDVCLCEYTSHGHCGLLDKATSSIDNDRTLEILVTQAVSHAKAGANVVAPSGMIDGMVQAIRQGLDRAGFHHIPILSYSVKYHSSFYGPFRMAAEGSPQFGDRSTHQMDPANGREALREVSLDVQEGADLLMVKPAHGYLDVIYRIKTHYPDIPLGAYHTSGEFAMIKAAAEKGWLEEKKAVFEVLRGIRRAGADFIISYYTKEVAKWLSK